MVPDDLRFTKEHEWVRVEGDEATVGITQYAADQLGDIVFVELPAVGRVLEQYATFGVVESVKAVSDLFAPVAGEVVAINDELDRQARAGERRAVRRGLDGQGAARGRGAGRGPARRRGVRAPRRRGLTGALRAARRRRSGPDARGDRRRLGRRPVRRHPGGRCAPARCASTRPSPSSSSAAGCPRWPPATASTSRASWAPARTATGRRPPSTSCCSAASGTRPTRPTSPR